MVCATPFTIRVDVDTLRDSPPRPPPNPDIIELLNMDPPPPPPNIGVLKNGSSNGSLPNSDDPKKPPSLLSITLLLLHLINTQNIPDMNGSLRPNGLWAKNCAKISSGEWNYKNTWWISYIHLVQLSNKRWHTWKFANGSNAGPRPPNSFVPVSNPPRSYIARFSAE